MSTALGYGRKSVVRRGVDAISVDKQRLAVSQAADKRDEELVWFEDAEGHRSGRQERTRPAYQRLLARLQNDPAVRSVIFYELDRAGRSVILIDRILKICQKKSVAFICLRDGIDTSHGLGANELMRIQLLAVLAEGEANRVAERMVDTARYYRDVLRIPWGMWPFGVRRAGEGEQARFSPDEPHDATVRRLLEIYVAGNGYRETAREMNRMGYEHVDRYGRRKEFGTETARAVVGNILFYAGYAVGVKHKAKQAKVSLEGEGTWLERYARAMKAQRAPAITPIVDEALASAVIERRFKSQLSGRKPKDWVALLTPIVYCQGVKLWAQARSYGHFYRTRQGGPNGVCLDADIIDREMLARLRGVRFPADMRAHIRGAIEEKIGASRRQELARQEAKLLGEMDLLVDLLGSKAIDREVYCGRYARLERQLGDVRAQMRAPDDVERIMGALTDLAAAIESMAPAKRKLAIQHIFERVDVSREGAIERLYLREWARAAFTDLAQCVSIMPPVSAEREADTRWLIARAA